MKEINITSRSGIPILAITLIYLFAVIAATPLMVRGAGPVYVIFLVLSIIASILILVGLYKVEPNQSAVLSLFGSKNYQTVLSII